MVRKLFICPPSIPEETYTRCVRLPASQEWLAVFNRALLTLIYSYNYEQLNPTDATPEECAAAAYQVYVDWLGGGCVTCSEVNECLPDLTAALLSDGQVSPNIINVNQAAPMESRFPQVQRDQPILTLEACNLDELWSGILEFVTRLDQYSLDFLERLVAEVDAVQRISQIVALVPLFGDIAGEALLLLADEAENLKNAYEAYQTQAVREEIACDLFQLGCAECRYPTWDEVIQYYETLSILDEGDYAEIAVQAIFDALVGTSGLANLVVWYTLNITQLYVRYLGGQWLEQITGRNFLPIWMELGEDAPSDAWIALCGGCPGVWQWTFDFEQSDHGFYVSGGGNYVAGEGWQGVTAWYNPDDEAVSINKDIVSYGGTVTGASMRVVRSASNSLIETIDHLNLETVSPPGHDTFFRIERVSQLDVTHTASGLSIPIASQDRLNAFSSVENLHPTITIKSITLTGTGQDPFV